MPGILAQSPEVHRRRGNPGRRPLPSQSTASARGDTRTPTAPKGLGKPGRAYWKKVWAAADWLSMKVDTDIIFRLCALQDERAEHEATLAKDGRFIEGSRGQTRVHPAQVQLRELERSELAYLRLCGLTPSDRQRMGHAVPEAVVSRLEQWRRKWDTDDDTAHRDALA